MNESMNDMILRSQVLDPMKSFIVRAPAGSGKTSLLIQRYLRLLSCVSRPEEILCMTFTRKAAAEMKGRIMKALNGAATESRSGGGYDRLLHDLATAALEQSAKRGWNLLENPGRLKIQTIDSFCHGITQVMPCTSQLIGAASIVDDARYLYEEAASQTIDALYSESDISGDVEMLLVYLDNDHRQLRALIAHMLHARNQWLRTQSHYDIGSSQSRQHIEASIQAEIHSALERINGVLSDCHRQELFELGGYGASNMAKKDSLIPALVDLDSFPATDWKQLSAWKGYAELLLTNTDKWRQQYTITVGFPPKGEHPNAQWYKERMLSLCRTLSQIPNLEADLAMMRQLPHGQLSDRQWAVIVSISRVMNAAMQSLESVFQRHGKVDFIQVAMAARQALGESECPTDLMLRLDYRIHHILVDEFQDTSHEQVELLTILTAGFEPEDGRTLFLVGDPMQSIYRFRYAEVALFIQAMDSQINDLNLELIELSSNFRSHPKVVKWVNGHFSRLLSARHDAPSGSVAYSESVAAIESSLPACGVAIHPLYHAGPEEESRYVVDLIKRYREENQSQSIALLVRSRSHLPHLLAKLKEAKIPFSGRDIDQLFSRPHCQYALALTKALIHLGDRAAWMALLRSPCIGLSLKDLLKMSERLPDKTVYERLLDHEIIGVLSSDAQQILQRVMPVLERALSNIGRLPLADLVERSWISLGTPATLALQAGQEMEMFFDLLRRFSHEGSLDSMERFERMLEKSFAETSEMGEAVQVMTIHKAKGLEFDCVILPGMGRRPRSEPPPLVTWMERGHQRLIVAPIDETGDENPYGSLAGYLRRLDKIKESNEVKRLLYVAATRAKVALHLVGTLKPAREPGLFRPAPHSFFHVIQDVIEELFHPENVPIKVEGEGEGAHYDSRQYYPSLQRLPVSWQRPPVMPSVKWQRQESLEASEHAEEKRTRFWSEEAKHRHIGTVTHAVLEWLAAGGSCQWIPLLCKEGQGEVDLSTPSSSPLQRGRVSTLLRREGVSDEDLPQAIDKVMMMVRNTLNDERGQWILAPHESAQNELKLTGLINGKLCHAVVDRTFIFEGKRWIIDYKTSMPFDNESIDTFLTREAETYRPQLETYTALLAQLDPNHPIQTALYFPAVQKFVPC